MKTSFLYAAALVAVVFATQALAAGEPAPEGVYDWSGFFVGAQAGGGTGNSRIDDNGLTGLDDSVHLDGPFAGGVFGYQRQWDHIVIGAEGEINWANIDGVTDLADAPGGNFINSRINWIGSANVKGGVAIGRVLAYGFVGVAFAGIDTGQLLPIGGTSFSESKNYVGWTGGAGIDYAVMPNVAVGGQVRYYDFGSERFAPPVFTARDQATHLVTFSGRVVVKLGNPN